MKKIYLIDANSFIYRMFFGLPEFATKDGKIVNAIFGMGKFFVNQLVAEKPDYIFFIKDARGDNFRHTLYADYKATRDRMPDNLKSQIADIEKMVFLMKIPLIEVPGYEADDVIATLATQLGKDQENDVFILSGDKDLYALITENVKIYDTMKKQVFNREKSIEKFGVPPEMVADYLSIVGDTSDNIPGIDGFGPKKAVDLINHIGGVEEIYQAVESIEKKEKTENDFPKDVQSCLKGKTFEKLISSKDDAFLSKKLATLEKNVPTQSFIKNMSDLSEFVFYTENLLNTDVKEFFKSLEFYSLIGEEIKQLTHWEDIGLTVKVITQESQLKNLQEMIKGHDKVVLDTETTSLNIMEAQLVGVSIYLDDENIYYINRLHEGEKIADETLQEFFQFLFSQDILIIGHNIKYDLEIIEMFMKQLTKTSHNSLPLQLSIL